MFVQSALEVAPAPTRTVALPGALAQALKTLSFAPLQVLLPRATAVVSRCVGCLLPLVVTDFFNLADVFKM